MAERTVLLTGWGRTAPTAARVRTVETIDEVVDAIGAAGPKGLLARGLGRSYGDAAQNAGGTVLDLGRLNAIGRVDDVTGELTCGAGACLDAVLRRAVPRGWFVPVTPGTRQVSLGGAVAADVHGKNHHRDGSLAGHITRLELVDGQARVRSLTHDDDLFWATVGGMGLTGVVTSVTMRMIAVDSAWMSVDTRRTSSLDDTMAALTDLDTRHRYSVAWIDCLARGAALGRGVVTAGDHLPAEQLRGPHAADPLRFTPRTPVSVSARVPSGLLGRRRIAAFNGAYYRRAPRAAAAVPTHSASFFHPLDALAGWNRLYGRGGFVQYQFLTPDPVAVADVLVTLDRARVPMLLGVLKRFGPGNAGPLSFPAAGWTLAVDIPAHTPDLGRALDAADRRVQASGGRVYLAKDARMAPAALAAMYPGLERWRELRAEADPHDVFTSDLARRLHL